MINNFQNNFYKVSATSITSAFQIWKQMSEIVLCRCKCPMNINEYCYRPAGSSVAVQVKSVKYQSLSSGYGPSTSFQHLRSAYDPVTPYKNSPKQTVCLDTSTKPHHTSYHKKQRTVCDNSNEQCSLAVCKQAAVSYLRSLGTSHMQTGSATGNKQH